MISLGKIISTEYDNLKRRVIKLTGLGKNDVQTIVESSPHGVDTNPVKDVVAVYAKTTEKGREVIVGYLVKEKIAEVGETRFFATDANGALKGYTWLKNDGTYEMLGKDNWAVKFTQMEEEFNKLKKDHNDFLAEYQKHIHPTNISAIVVSATISTQTANTSDMSKAKNAKIKTND